MGISCWAPSLGPPHRPALENSLQRKFSDFAKPEQRRVMKTRRVRRGAACGALRSYSSRARAAHGTPSSAPELRRPPTTDPGRAVLQNAAPSGPKQHRAMGGRASRHALPALRSASGRPKRSAGGGAGPGVRRKMAADPFAFGSVSTTVLPAPPGGGQRWDEAPCPERGVGLRPCLRRRRRRRGAADPGRGYGPAPGPPCASSSGAGATRRKSSLFSALMHRGAQPRTPPSRPCAPTAPRRAPGASRYAAPPPPVPSYPLR